MSAEDSRPSGLKRGLVVRVVLGLLLVGGAIALVVWPRGQQLKISWRLTESLAGPGGKFRELEEVPAGETAALRVRIELGPDAPEGARPVCNAQSRPRVLVAGAKDLVFERRLNAALEPGDEIPVSFTADESASPGPREVRIQVTAELEVPGEAVLRTASLSHTITVKVVAARPKPGPKAGEPKPD